MGKKNNANKYKPINELKNELQGGSTTQIFITYNKPTKQV